MANSHVLLMMDDDDDDENQIVPSQLPLGVEVDANELALRCRTNKYEQCNNK